MIDRIYCPVLRSVVSLLVSRVIDDRTLLRRYAVEHDEGAFAEVVRRNLPFVYSAALRRLGRDTHLAQDITQLVFCALARNAHRISYYSTVSGWLYTATRNAVSNVVREEKRRRTREEEACHMIEPEPDAPADWSKLRPVLDSALDRLGARDREAVLLRFFQGRSFSEIGAAIGLSEEAARKRTDRALAKLRDLLRPHGAASTSTALAALLLSQTLTAAPEGLLPSVTSAALSTGGAATGISAFITMTKLQVGIAAAVVVASAVGLISQQRTISNLRQKAAAAEERLAEFAQRGASVSQPRERADIALPQRRSDTTKSTANPLPRSIARGQMQAETAAALQNRNVTDKYFALMPILQRLSGDNWREVLQAFAEERRLHGLDHAESFEMFVRRAGEVAGEDAVSYFLTTGNIKHVSDALMGWASQNPAEAFQWLGHGLDSAARKSVLAGAIRGLALSEPDLAIKALEDQPAKERSKYTSELVTSMLHAVGIAATQQLMDGMIARAGQAGSLGEPYLKSLFYDYGLLRIYQSAASGTISDAVTWLNPHIAQPYFDQRLIAEATAKLAAENPVETFRWLEGVNNTRLQTGTGPAGYRVLLDTWQLKEGPGAVETWLQTQTSHPHYDYIAYQYATFLLRGDPQKAAQWAESIKDATMRKNALEHVTQKGPKKNS